MYIYLILTLYVAPQFSLCLKQYVLAAALLPMNLLCYYRLDSVSCLSAGFQQLQRLHKPTFSFTQNPIPNVQVDNDYSLFAGMHKKSDVSNF